MWTSALAQRLPTPVAQRRAAAGCQHLLRPHGAVRVHMLGLDHLLDDKVPALAHAKVDLALASIKLHALNSVPCHALSVAPRLSLLPHRLAQVQPATALIVAICVEASAVASARRVRVVGGRQVIASTARAALLLTIHA